MITALKVKGGMTKNDYIGHIEYSSGQNKTTESRAGSGAVVEILKEAELIQEENGRLVAVKNLDPTPLEKEEVVVDTRVGGEKKIEDEKRDITSSISKKVSIGQDNNVTININVQLTVPETTDENVYDKFFEAMKKHLLS